MTITIPPARRSRRALALIAVSTLLTAAAPTTDAPARTLRQPEPLLAPPTPAATAVSSWDEALAVLRQRSPDLRDAEAGIERAEGVWQQALAALLPDVRATAAVAVDLLAPSRPLIVGMAGVSAPLGGDGDRAPSAPLGTAAVVLSQPLLDLSAWRGLDAANAGREGAQADLHDAQRSLTQGLARALVASVAAERAAELNRVGLLQALERAELTERAVELGAGNQLDVVRVRQDAALAREALIAGDEQLRRIREALGLALGSGRAVGVTPAFDLSSLADEARRTCSALPALDDRDDLRARRAELAAARARRAQAWAGHLPTVGLQSALSAYTTDPGVAQLGGWSIAAVLSIPLFEGGERQGLVRERAAAERRAEAALDRTLRDASIEAERSRRATEVAIALVGTASASRTLAERLDRLTRRGFEVGRGNSLELVESGAALRRAELTLALREFELVQARLDSFFTEARCDW